MNRTITVVLLAVLTALLLVAGTAGPLRLTVALAAAITMNFAIYCFEGKAILWMHSAREIKENDAAPLHRIVAELATRLDLAMPKIYLIPQETSKIFTLGRGPGQAALAVTTGFLRLVDRRELPHRIACELSHIRSRDALLTAIAVPIAATVTVLANSLFWATLLGGDSAGERQDGKRLGYVFGTVMAPMLAFTVKTAICRRREQVRTAGSPIEHEMPLGEVPLAAGGGGERGRR